MGNNGGVGLQFQYAIPGFLFKALLNGYCVSYTRKKSESGGFLEPRAAMCQSLGKSGNSVGEGCHLLEKQIYCG